MTDRAARACCRAPPCCTRSFRQQAARHLPGLPVSTIEQLSLQTHLRCFDRDGSGCSSDSACRRNKKGRTAQGPAESLDVQIFYVPVLGSLTTYLI